MELKGLKMPIPNYSGQTCVAFLDVSGFKQMMKRGIKAEIALNKFYNTIFRVSGDFRTLNNRITGDIDPIRISSLVVSDCAVVFVDNQRKPEDKARDLESILNFILQINRDLISDSTGPRIMTTCSIDYGYFKYQERIEFENLGKEYFYGQPYVNAFLDNEDLKNKPGYCRILKKNLMVQENLRTHFPYSLLEDNGNYYYFYWMLDNPDETANFKREYKNLSQDVYEKMAALLQKRRYPTVQPIG
jgi:hypothetical protein